MARQGKLKICVISVLSGAWGLFIFFRLDAKENGTKRKDQGCISAATLYAAELMPDTVLCFFLPVFADEK